MAYQTKQQQAVLRCLQLRAEECLSAADLSEELRHGGLTVGLATVYRQLDKLTQLNVQIADINNQIKAVEELRAILCAEHCKPAERMELILNGKEM